MKSTYGARTSSVEINEWQSARAETLFRTTTYRPQCTGYPMGVSSTRSTCSNGSNQPGSTLWTLRCNNLGKLWELRNKLAKAWTRFACNGKRDGKALIFRSDNWSPNVYIGTMARTAHMCWRTSD